MNDITQLRKLETQELEKEVRENKKKLFELRMKQRAGELKQTHLVAQLRKRVAVLKTLLTEKKV